MSGGRGSRDAAAARKLAFVGSHAGAHNPLGIAQFGHCHADRGPGKRPVFGGRRRRGRRKHRAAATERKAELRKLERELKKTQAERDKDKDEVLAILDQSA